ncbi:dNA/RNA helicase, superfamily II [Mycobacterium xenopi 4042]|uniref:DNA/RNA helicase, superfamily II n=1 Tax=Mycobacterium xenopi 4042 TaxID=1299334 RepID=X7YJT1_MYCXE|nr:dNA/RNA helicase, superfamily II [Mycobacterium xenopi 4042]
MTSDQVLGRGGQVVGDLQAQFAGGHHDQCPWVAAEPGLCGDALQQWHAERQGLAHAGAGLADHVFAGQRQRQGEFLDGKRAFNALIGQGSDYFVANPQFGKRWGRCGNKGGHAWAISLSVLGSVNLVAFRRVSGVHECLTPNTLPIRRPCAAQGGPTACTHIIVR